MREIKFRALKDDMSNCVFYYGSLIYNKNGDPRIHDINTDLFHTCLKKTEGQFTGLQDKNGIDIYEHDICNIYESNPNSTKSGMIVYGKSVIRFYGSAFVYGYPCFGGGLANLFLGNMTSDFIEVIGNIHENPTLL